MLVKFPRATRYPIKEANPCLTPYVFLGRRLTSPVGVWHHALPEVLACPLHDFATSLYRSTYGGCSSFFGFPARSRPKKKISRPAGLSCSESISLSVRADYDPCDDPNGRKMAFGFIQVSHPAGLQLGQRHLEDPPVTCCYRAVLPSRVHFDIFLRKMVFIEN